MHESVGIGEIGGLWSPAHVAAPEQRAAGLGLFLVTLAVTPAHMDMLQRPELFLVPLRALWLGPPIRVALLGLIAWPCVQTAGRSPADARHDKAAGLAQGSR